MLRPGERQRSLAEPRSRLDHGELLFLQLSDQGEQPRPFEQSGWASRRQDLGGEELRLFARDHVVLRVPIPATSRSESRIWSRPSTRASSSCNPPNMLPERPFWGMPSPGYPKNCGPIGLLTQLPRRNLLRQKADHPAA